MVRGSVIVRRCSQCRLSGHNFTTCSKKNNNNITTTIASANNNSNNTSTTIANYNNNNAGLIKIFGVYFQKNVDDHDLNASVGMENRSSKSVEHEVYIDAERKKGIIFKFTLYIYTNILVLFYMFWFITCLLCVYGIHVFWFLSFSTFLWLEFGNLFIFLFVKNFTT